MPHDENILGFANPWHPENDPVALKHLGKLAEELGECSAVVSRCIIQGINEREPVTGILNREWLQDEIADVFCNAILVMEHFDLDRVRIEARASKKKIHLQGWHRLA